MVVREIINMLEDVKRLEEKLKEFKIAEEHKAEIFYITLEMTEGVKIRFEPSSGFSQPLLSLFIKTLTEDYVKNIEELKKLGIKITNVFEKEKIETQIKKLQSELDELWGRGLFTEGTKVQECIKDLENKLNEL